MPSNTIAELMIRELKSEAEMTRKLIARIPQDKLDFTPGHGLRTAGWNAGHLADIVGWVPGVLNAPGMDAGDFEAEQSAAVAHAADLDAVLRTFDANLAGSLVALESATDAQMDESWTMSMNGQPIFTMPKGECLSKWVFTHTAHHRGILSATLRLAGVEHGSIYEE